MTGAVEIPAYTFVCLGMDILGRRTVLAFSLLSGAVSCGVIMLIPRVSSFTFYLGDDSLYCDGLGRIFSLLQ